MLNVDALGDIKSCQKVLLNLNTHYKTTSKVRSETLALHLEMTEMQADHNRNVGINYL